MMEFVTQQSMQGTRRMRKPHGGHHVMRTDFFIAGKDEFDKPQAFLAESTPLRSLRPHYHEVDQFQLIVSGSGRLGHHELKPFGIHFARAYTPYGPIVNGPAGLGFITLRAHPVPGPGQNIPANAEKLKSIPDRQPWQTTRQPVFETAGKGGLQPIAGMSDERGLAACTVALPAGGRCMLPDPRDGDGQYVVILEGSAIAPRDECPALSVAFLRPDDAPLTLAAGPRGLKAMVLNFPRRVAPAVYWAQPAKGAFKKWRCELCSFVYDEAAGMPGEGIAAGTRWQDVADTWSCPDCSAAKNEFQMVEV